jgi:hypothetical protein
MFGPGVSSITSEATTNDSGINSGARVKFGSDRHYAKRGPGWMPAAIANKTGNVIGGGYASPD